MRLKEFIYKHTHRIVKKKVTTPNLDVGERWCPQWWFIWWHYNWREIGYQFMIPISYESKEEAEFMLDKTIPWTKKQKYWDMKSKQKQKINELNRDFR